MEDNCTDGTFSEAEVKRRREMERAHRGGTVITSRNVNRWMRAPSERTMVDLANLFVARNYDFESDAAAIAATVVLPYLVSETEKGGGEFTRGEALSMLRYAFVTDWDRNGCNSTTARVIKEWLTRVMAKWPDGESELVLITILEHLLMDQSVREYFEDWRSDSQLSKVFVEAEHLADGFLNMHKDDSSQ